MTEGDRPDSTRPDQETIEAAQELLEHCDIFDIRPSQISAEIMSEVPEAVSALSLDVASQYASGPGLFRNRFTFHFDFVDVADESVAEMAFVLVVEWEVADEYEPSAAGAEYVASTTGYFAAFPYARELAQSMTSRLGLDPLVLGKLTRNEMKPGGVRMVIRAPASGTYPLQPEEAD
jgi:hypothetical protein